VISAPADRATNPREWSSPVTILMPRPAGSSPDIISSPDGTLYLAFAIPINELRGIYLSRSEDNGRPGVSQSLCLTRWMLAGRWLMNRS
jgi:hypothetical protein